MAVMKHDLPFNDDRKKINLATISHNLITGIKDERINSILSPYLWRTH